MRVNNILKIAFMNFKLDGILSVDTNLDDAQITHLNSCIKKFEEGAGDAFNAIADIACWKYVIKQKPEMELLLDEFLDWKCAGDGMDIIMFIDFNPEFENSFRRSDAWQFFEANDWVFILVNAPRFADKCDEVDGWAKLSHDDWDDVIDFNPQFFEKSKTYGYTGDFPDWANCQE